MNALDVKGMVSAHLVLVHQGKERPIIRLGLYMDEQSKEHTQRLCCLQHGRLERLGADNVAESLF